MASGRIILDGFEPVIDTSGNAVAGATLHVYLNGTTTPAAIFQDPELTTAALNPQTSNAAGYFRAQSTSLWADASALYTIRLTYPSGAVVTRDDVTVLPDEITLLAADADVRVIASIAALRTATWPGGRPTLVQLSTNYVANDSGGLFRADLTDTSTTDNGVTVIVGADGVRWRRMFSGRIDARWAGASPANTAGQNDTAFARLNALGAATPVYLPAGTYLTSLVPLQITWAGEGPGRIETTPGTDRPPGYYRLIQNPTSRGSREPMLFDGDNKFVEPEYWIMNADMNGVNQYYNDKTLTPHWVWMDVRSVGSSGMLSSLASSISVGATSATLVSADGITVGMTIAFWDTGLAGDQRLQDPRVVTSIVGNVISWSGGTANAYSAGHKITNSPRIMQAPYHTHMVARSRGDIYCHFMRIQSSPLVPILAGQEHIWDHQTIGHTGGDIILSSYTYGTGIEIHINDAAGSVGNGAIWAVQAFERNNADQSRGGQWLGTFLQSYGLQKIDCGFSQAGQINCAFDTTLASLASDQCAYGMAKGQRVQFNRTSTPLLGVSLWGRVAGTTWIGQRSDNDALEAVVNGNPLAFFHPNGEAEFPLSTCVIARQSATTTNVTGDGTIATVVFDTEILDRGGSYNPTTGVFTAKTIGAFSVRGKVLLTNVGPQTVGRLFVVASSSTSIYYFDPEDIRTGDGVACVTFSDLVFMGPGDTLVIQIMVAGGAKTVSVVGGTNLETNIGIVREV